jgi:hypothetical protein
MNRPAVFQKYPVKVPDFRKITENTEEFRGYEEKPKDVNMEPVGPTMSKNLPRTAEAANYILIITHVNAVPVQAPQQEPPGPGSGRADGWVEQRTHQMFAILTLYVPRISASSSCNRVFCLSFACCSLVV